MKRPTRQQIMTALRGVPLWWRLFALTSMLSTLPIMSNFVGNRYQVTVQDLILPVLLGLIPAAVISAGFAWVGRRDRLAAYIGAILTILAVSFNYDGWLWAVYGRIAPALHLPSFDGWGGILESVVMLVAMVVAAYWAARLLSLVVRKLRWKGRDIAGAAAVGITVTFLFQAVPLTVVLVQEWPQFFYKPPALNVTAKAKVTSKPDIYYIVLDRYASEDVLSQQFNFDNSDFLNFLTSSGYYMNPSAHNNYPYTTMSIASTMDADYLNDVVDKFGKSPEQTIIPFNESIRNSAVAQQLKALGYSYNLIGNWYETSNVSPLANTSYQITDKMQVFNHTFILNDFSKDFLKQSLFWRFVMPGIHIGNFNILSVTDATSVDMTHYALQSLKDLAAKPTGGRFIFAHILVPHDPYFFNADGSLAANPSGDNVGEPVQQKYLGQVQFINSQMKQILTDINTSSKGQAVVVLQSDEGPYPTQLGNDEDFSGVGEDEELKAGDMRKWSDASLAMKFGNLAAYHIPGMNPAVDADAADSVNVFRLVLNSEFGTGLPYLPDCYYAYPDGKDKPESFTDITSRLTSTAEDPRCLANGTVKQ